ncbi:Hsp20/alpha crystallin family protein [Bacillus infantis]|jgi:HSP20 family protein|uniref:Hsp20/alpha crystallin family protein n=1 Tax=Bacillus infantis TaxID=324767 RepID=UPI00215564A4|nr:Hsp20/alpha crystallin family protein [Bacillus infantis]MCR6611594.1 Hsp20/alpha crystallin family protein [Bacillus infantis]
MELEQFRHLLEWSTQVQNDPLLGSLNKKNPEGQNMSSNLGSAFFGQQGSVPRCDVYKSGSTVIVEAELPGIERQEIKVQMAKDEIIIKGKYLTLLPNREYLIKERPSLKFEKKLSIPYQVIRQEIKTSFKEGLLVIIIPIHEDEEAVDIPFQMDT